MRALWNRVLRCGPSARKTPRLLWQRDAQVAWQREEICSLYEKRNVHRRAVQPAFFGFSFGQSESTEGASETITSNTDQATSSSADSFAYDVAVRSKRTTERMSRCESVEQAMSVYRRSRDRANDLGLPCFDNEVVRKQILPNLLKRQVTTSQQVVEYVEAINEVYKDLYRWKATTASTYFDVLLAFKKCIQGRYRDGALLIALRGAIINVHRCLLQESEDERAVHNMVNITALMNAYNHVGLAQSALEIWQRLLISHSPVAPATVSVVFDTCGFSGLLQEAHRVFAYVSHPARKTELMDKNVWDSYLECLARCNQLRAAIDLAVHQMPTALQERNAAMKLRTREEKVGQYDHRDYEPDERTFRILLLFAAAKRDARGRERDTTIYHDLRKEIKTRFPVLWPVLQDVGTGKR